MGIRLLIVGGVAGGASCATRARRLSEEAEIVIFEKGPYVSFANCGLPYHLGGEIAEREKLLVTRPEMLRARFGIDVRTRHEVTRIDRAKKEVEVRNLDTGEARRERYDKLVLSPGAEPIRPPLPGFDLPGIFTLRDIPDMDAIARRIQEMTEPSPEESDASGGCAREAIVVGGGYIGLEMAENLKRRGLGVLLVERLPQVMPFLDPEMAEEVHQALERNGVQLRLGTSVAEFAPAGARIEARLDNGEKHCSDLVILSVGVRPNVRLGRDAGLAVGPAGGYSVDSFMRTNDPDIYAVGDAVETPSLVTGKPGLFVLAGPANRQGRLAADHIFAEDAGAAAAAESAAGYRGSQGTAIARIFDRTAACVGLSEAACRREGIACESVYAIAQSHAGYFPGAQPMLLKLVFSPAGGAIFGAQIVGGNEGVDKRIDVLATAQRARMTVFDLEHLELAYAPPYGSAKDPVNMLGFIAADALRGHCPLGRWEDVEAQKGGTMVLDVRMAQERKMAAVPESLHIPLDDLRGAMDRLPKDREILVHCAGGQRSYYATRILRQNGFNAKNLPGGMRVYSLRNRARHRGRPA